MFTLTTMPRAGEPQGDEPYFDALSETQRSGRNASTRVRGGVLVRRAGALAWQAPLEGGGALLFPREGGFVVSEEVLPALSKQEVSQLMRHTGPGQVAPLRAYVLRWNEKEHALPPIGLELHKTLERAILSAFEPEVLKAALRSEECGEAVSIQGGPGKSYCLHQLNMWGSCVRKQYLDWCIHETIRLERIRVRRFELGWGQYLEACWKKRGSHFLKMVLRQAGVEVSGNAGMTTCVEAILCLDEEAWHRACVAATPVGLDDALTLQEQGRLALRVEVARRAAVKLAAAERKAAELKAVRRAKRLARQARWKEKLQAQQKARRALGIKPRRSKRLARVARK